ncbi:MAG: SpoIID/LytB domain-containing protein [Firmicutes bacterium]|nr:SpoIID/LytB domain-containing protein [Bacillota bacterium]
MFGYSFRQLIISLLLLFLSMSAFFGCRLPGSEEVEPFREEPGQGEGELALPPGLEAEPGQEPVLRVYIAEEGAVKEMPMEEYIAGVVAGEMDLDWPIEALAAQAIIARTFTLQKIVEEGGVSDKNAHASTDIEEFQAYNAAEITERVRKAVGMTRGKVAVHKNEYIRGWFSAYAGPRTALADEGLGFDEGNPPYIHIVESPGKRIVPEEEGEWEHQFDLEEVRQAVLEQTGKDPGPVEKVEIVEKGPSGRATLLRINDEEIEAPDFRLALGSTEMRSTFLEELELEEGMLKMAGTGYGHGVGMCQWGARAMAEEGKTHEEIVSYFYKDVDIVKIWD